MFHIRVYAEYSSDSYNGYDEDIVESWDEVEKLCKKFLDGCNEGENVDIGIEIFDDSSKKFVDLDFNNFSEKILEYGKTYYSYDRHDHIKED